MVCNSNVLIVREDHKILRIVTADRKSEFLIKKSCLCVNLIHGNRILTCGCAEQMPSIRCKCKTRCGIMECILILLFRKCADTLKQFELRSMTTSVIAVNLNLITQLEQDIGESAISTETNDPRAALSRAAKNVNQFQLMLSLIDTIEFNLIDSVINCTQVFIIRCRTHTVYMRAEVTLCNTSKSLVVNTIHNTAKTSVAAGMYNCHLAIMISCHIQIFTIYICCQEAASHTVNADSVDAGQISVLITSEHCHTFVLDRIQKLAILRDRCMRCIADLYFASFSQCSLLNIYIINLNTFTVAVGICSHIGYVFLVPHDIAS